MILVTPLIGRVLQSPNLHYVEDCAKDFSQFGTFPYGCASDNVSTSRPSSSGDPSSPIIGKQDGASATRCSTPAWWATSKSDSDSRRHHLTRFPVSSVMFNIHCSVSWSVPDSKT